MTTPVSLSLVIPTMRKPSLVSVLDYYAEVEADINIEILIVDYDHEYTVKQIREKFRNGREVSAIRVSSRRRFNKSEAINVGVAEARGEILLVNDADVMVDVDTLCEMHQRAASGEVSFLREVRESVGLSRRRGPGIICIRRSDMIAVAGYDSRFAGWGLEDHDLLERLARWGHTPKGVGMGVHISHSDEERVANYAVKNIAQSRDYNRHILEKNRLENQMFGTLFRDCSSVLYDRVKF